MRTEKRPTLPHQKIKTFQYNKQSARRKEEREREEKKKDETN